MNKDFMSQLKNELCVIKTDLVENNHYPSKNSGILGLDIWGKYYIVTCDGTMFIINCFTKKFPEIDFDKIEMIVKQDIGYTDDYAYEMFEKFGYEKFFDSNVGQYFAEEINTYGLEIKSSIYSYENE